MKSREEETVQKTVRLPHDIANKVEELARTERRTFTGQVEKILFDHFDRAAITAGRTQIDMAALRDPSLAERVR